MGVKNTLEGLIYNHFTQRVKHPALPASELLGEAINYSAPLASILVLGSNPDASVVGKAIGGVYNFSKLVGDIVFPYLTNEGVRNATWKFMGDAGEILSNVPANIIDGIPTLAAVAGVYAAGKIATKAVKHYTNNLRKYYRNKDIPQY